MRCPLDASDAIGITWTVETIVDESQPSLNLPLASPFAFGRCSVPHRADVKASVGETGRSDLQSEHVQIIIQAQDRQCVSGPICRNVSRESRRLNLDYLLFAIEPRGWGSLSKP